MNMRHSSELPLDAIAWYAWETEELESNWLLTYVDMLSVLLAMLVVLLGQMAAQRLQAPEAAAMPGTTVETRVAATTAMPERLMAKPAIETTATPKPATPAAETPHAVAERAAMAEVLPQKPVAETVSVPVASPAVAAEASQSAPPPEAKPATPSEPSPEARLATAIENRFKGEIKVVRRDHGISLEISEVILFESGKADLLPAAGPVLAHLAATLQEAGETQIAVEGHTDDRPIRGGRFRSNWELAAARANAVTQFLLNRGFDPERLRSVSYADTRPVADNGTAAGRAANRRVNLRIDFL
ncbi:MAG: OmpA family protein [Candidatus Thiodiazotropha sp.]